ncbi:hypothetical protein [Burkholderia oklahomensis]|uniref:hypothetical protein n=1 Tax=Burkholderia oklahomensis TaxID=342113 RepID=UPI00016A7954|nr:hypothetical protein [Burkholderia oklahomensis]AJX32356.1 hypothetical protein BG90_323 [Burkholderia oklahomensis C6786]AOI46510.1 hypothetical protein WI23_12390 [Burkholderia oklahomensis C6786]KUY56409.1 hypothetical protein WI23_19495 [Burkholderia oklahomensis C6786]MBI0360867.1 hypothetical protein [Burkholderia oklahomensis]SUW60243.1 Uncharacterised protein [Burkholderia oklahomensis]
MPFETAIENARPTHRLDPAAFAVKKNLTRLAAAVPSARYGEIGPIGHVRRQWRTRFAFGAEKAPIASAATVLIVRVMASRPKNETALANASTGATRPLVADRAPGPPA